ncbi:MAG TPA: hypothetical protein VNZ26_30685 [Vicinamibacterales bacterium]|jgi:hypothetical protein|nr:hypothetical protein [Vicinamibacterales bacterium]
MTPTPLLDFFKRGDVARDARLLAAQGVIAPRALEQLAILVLLLEDVDPEIRSTADGTLQRIPQPALAGFLARSDVPVGLREFFANRGVFPSVTPAIEVDEPLIEEDSLIETDAGREGSSGPGGAGEAGGPGEAGGSDEDALADQMESTTQAITKMGFTQRLRAAMKGTREMRSILIRDPNKMISAAVLSSPKVSEPEVENFARMANVGEDVLRIIGNNRAWMKNYGVVLGLTKNPKTPVGMSLNLLARLNVKDVAQLAVDRNVPEALRVAARKRAAQNRTGG